MEKDPNGMSAHSAGSKLDAGKLRAGLVLGSFAHALAAVAAVGTFGANKYTPNGWVTVNDGINRYTDAMLRHFLKEAIGEQVDTDSGLHHAAHLAWNALARLELLIREREEGIPQDSAPPMLEPLGLTDWTFEHTEGELWAKHVLSGRA